MKINCYDVNQKVIYLIAKNPKITRDEIANNLQISLYNVKSIIEELKKGGRLGRVGGSRGEWVVYDEYNERDGNDKNSDVERNDNYWFGYNKDYGRSIREAIHENSEEERKKKEVQKRRKLARRLRYRLNEYIPMTKLFKGGKVMLCDIDFNNYDRVYNDSKQDNRFDADPLLCISMSEEEKYKELGINQNKWLYLNNCPETAKLIEKSQRIFTDVWREKDRNKENWNIIVKLTIREIADNFTLMETHYRQLLDIVKSNRHDKDKLAARKIKEFLNINNKFALEGVKELERVNMDCANILVEYNKDDKKQDIPELLFGVYYATMVLFIKSTENLINYF